MSEARGARAGDYRAPLFLAWQLTNRCRCSCLHCCEESGPDEAWKDELSRQEALKLAHDVVSAGIPYVAFGGGEPMAVPHFWEVLKVLYEGGVGLKIETDGLCLDDAAADRFNLLGVHCVQVSVDGATKAVHESLRPGGDFDGAVEALRRLAKRALPAELVFSPARLNVHEAADAYDLAVEVGARAFITGPLMRLGRAARAYDRLAVSETRWREAVERLHERAVLRRHAVRLAVYPWDVVTEMTTRLASPQAMLLVVPDGKVKLLNALPFAPADLRRQTLAEAWDACREAWRSDEVRAFIHAARSDPSLLLHANETWLPQKT